MMAMTWAFSLAVFAVFCHEARGQTLDCTNTAALQREQMKCYEQYNIQLSGDGGQDIMAAIQNDATAFCSIGVEKYRPALECALNVARTCTEQLSVTTDILPSTDRLVDGIVYICQNAADLNPTCITNRQSALTQCATNRASELDVRGKSVVEITCMAMNVAYQCMEVTLPSCGQKTVEVMLTYLNDYVRPPACTSRFTSIGGVAANKASGVFMMIVAVFVLGVIY